MNDAEAATALELYFYDNWIETEVYFNQVPANPADGDEFVAFWVLPATTIQVGLGATPGFRSACVVQVDVNVPAGTGTRRAIELGDQVSELFLGKQIDGVTIRDKFVNEIVVEGFYRRILSFNGYYDQTVS